MKRAEFMALVKRADAVTMAIHERTIGLRRLQDQIVLALNKRSAASPGDRWQRSASQGQVGN
jgi:hypothetical protein